MSKEFKIGAICIVAIAILIYGINYLKGINLFKSTNSYYVEFANVNGISKSSPVFACGYQVGLVSSMTYNYDHPGHVLVQIRVNNSMRIPQGTTARLESDLLGIVKMNLQLNLDTNEFMQRGDTIRGDSNNGLMGEVSNLLPTVGALVPKLDSILTTLNQLLSNPALQQTLQHTEKLTSNLEQTSTALNKLIKSDMPNITTQLAETTSHLNQLTGKLSQIDYASLMRNVDATLQNVQQFTNQLNAQDGTLGKLLNDSTLYNNINATSANAASLLNDLQQHPKRYVHFSLFGRKE